MSNFTLQQTKDLATERAVDELTIEGLRNRELIGSCYVEKWKARCICFPISSQKGDVFRAHCRSPQRNSANKWDWAYQPAKDPKDFRQIPALVFGNPDTATKRLVFESQWDGVALIDRLSLFDEIDSGETLLIITRGAEISNRLEAFNWTANGIAVYAFAQNDEHGKKWLNDVLKATGGAYVVGIPEPHKDLGEWVKDGAAGASDLEGAMNNAELRQPAADASDPGAKQEEPYKPKGNSPTGYSKKGITQDDILLGDGFLEREGAALLAGPSGVGKSSVAMQMGCCWACSKAAFHFVPPRPLRIVMMQHEDSQNDLVRQSAIVDWLGLDQALIDKNFWIETVRGQIGAAAVKIMYDLVKWWRADLLILNPLTAYHDGDISQNKDNVRFLYGEIGRLLSELRIALFAFHHKGKPPRGGSKNGHETIDSEIMYELLGGSVLTNFFRGIVTLSPIANSGVYKFTCAKRFEQSGWTLANQQYKWHDDRTKRLWVPASVAETENARKGSAKTLEDLYKLAPPLGSIPKESFERTVIGSGFSRRDYRGLLAQALDDSTPDNLRLYQWSVYNPQGLAKASISRFEQSADETHQAMKEAKAQERKAKKA